MRVLYCGIATGLVLFALLVGGRGSAPPTPRNDDFATVVRPFITKYCSSCHNAKVKKSGLDLVRFTSLEKVRQDIKPWEALIEQLEAGEMPPKGNPRPTSAEQKRIIARVRRILDAEALARAGDPGH